MLASFAIGAVRVTARPGNGLAWFVTFGAMAKGKKLAPWLGATPTSVLEDKRHPGYGIGRVDAGPTPRDAERVPLGDSWYALWGPSGDVVVGVPGTVLMAFMPGRDEIALVRQEGVKTPKKRCETWFERWTLDGKRTSQLLVDPKLPLGNLALLTFAAKDKGKIVKVESADEDGRYAFFVAIGDGAPDRAAATRDELAGKVVNVPPAKRAANLLTPAADLAALAQESVDLAILVAGNWAAPPALLASLAKHADARVRAVVATNGGLAIADQHALARDPDVDVRLALFRMRNVYDAERASMRRTAIDASTVAILAKDTDKRVRAAYVKSYGASEVALDEEPLEVRLAAVKWGIPIAKERELAKDPSADVRLKLAVSRHPRKCGRSPSIDGEALALLMNDKSKRVRDAAAELTAYPPGAKTPPP